MLLIGAHMSIGGGFFNSLYSGKELGCATIQIFTKSANQWKAKELTSEDIEKFKQAQKETGIIPVVGHDSYLINIASGDKELLQKSREALLLELTRSEKLGLSCLVMHPGSNPDEKEGIKRIADSLSWVHSKSKNYKTKICLETTAGQGSSIGYKFEQIAQIIDLTQEDERLGVCYDTAHTFEAGYDIRDKKVYEKTFKLFNKIIGLNRLKVIHMNDSKKDLGSRVDRHEHIGKGFIGLEAFKLILNDRRFEMVPKILETPKEEDMDEKNLATLRNLYKG
ncbi:MAG TPA: deoxyribonuclease IV [candidate division Zixibacteria bacterium]